MPAGFADVEPADLERLAAERLSRRWASASHRTGPGRPSSGTDRPRRVEAVGRGAAAWHMATLPTLRPGALSAKTVCRIDGRCPGSQRARFPHEGARGRQQEVFRIASDASTRAAPDLTAAQVIVLPGDERFAVPTKHALQRFRGSIAGPLTDALLDPQYPLAGRRQVPDMLANDSSADAALALGLASTAHRFDVRYCAAKGALRARVATAPSVPSRALSRWRVDSSAIAVVS
jgi:hypothetical protein